MNRLRTIVLLSLIVTATCFSFVSAAETSKNSDFPRLGMWWPDPKEQPLKDIARYDFVTLFDYQKDYVAPLKTLNSQQILLNSTNACELSYGNPDDPNDFGDSNFSEIPAEWFLTQVGSTLSTNINATTTTIRVDNLSVSDGEESYTLFEKDDVVLIEGESVLVLAVNEVSKTLTVERGYRRPASAHIVGTRIAAHISFWPGSVLLNLSTLSPTAIIDPAIGAERWGDYNARFGAELLTTADWDGLLIDRADPDQSWLLGNSNARTIDPDQSNTLITDYSAFNTAWNEGLRNYQSKLRQLVGTNKILFTNWGIDNYDLINGNNYEAFPRSDGSSWGSWHDTVFGSIPNVGSYAQWIEQGIQPNLTMIETYQDDEGPQYNEGLEYANPCTLPDFDLDYRKMRFGLTTALLNDGYFSWEINTNGHGKLCLKWFDEYDNAGQGMGYLGQPLGAAYRPAGLAVGTNQVVGGAFDNQEELDLWGFWADSDSGSVATISLDAGGTPSGTTAVRVNVTQASGVDWQVSLTHSPLVLEAGEDYTISFWAKADRQRVISLWAQMSESPWDNYFSGHEENVGTDWRQYEYTATASTGNVPGEFAIGFGQETGTVWIDDVRIQKGNRDVWRRDFTGGSVIVNATQAVKTIDLGKTLRKIKGSQVPDINDGNFVTEVTIPPLDGLILLAESSLPCAALPLELVSGKWQQISLPCELPVDAQTVEAVFADDLNGSYGADWRIFSFDATANRFFDVGLNGILIQGSSYWIVHANGVVATLDLPTGSTKTASTPLSQCVSETGCYSIPLSTKAESVQWNMLGHPFSNSVALNRWRVVTNSGICTKGCTLDQAKANNIVDNKLWHFGDGVYKQLRGNMSVNPWTGFFIKVLKGGSALEPKLVIPAN